MHSFERWRTIRDDVRPVVSSSATGYSKYEVLYRVPDDVQAGYESMIDRLLDELESLRMEGVDIKFQGAVEHGADGEPPSALTAWFAAPHYRAIGRLNRRAALPSCGIRRVKHYREG